MQVRVRCVQLNYEVWQPLVRIAILPHAIKISHCTRIHIINKCGNSLMLADMQVNAQMLYEYNAYMKKVEK